MCLVYQVRQKVFIRYRFPSVGKAAVGEHSREDAARDDGERFSKAAGDVNNGLRRLIGVLTCEEGEEEEEEEEEEVCGGVRRCAEVCGGGGEEGKRGSG